MQIWYLIKKGYGKLYYLTTQKQRFGTLEVDGKEICGYAVIFDSWSQDLGGFYERILPSAITPEFLKTQDVTALWMHNDKTGVLARYYKGEKGTLKLSVDEKGLFYSFKVKNTPLHQESIFHDSGRGRYF